MDIIPTYIRGSRQVEQDKENVTPEFRFLSLHTPNLSATLFHQLDHSDH